MKKLILFVSLAVCTIYAMNDTRIFTDLSLLKNKLANLQEQLTPSQNIIPISQPSVRSAPTLFKHKNIKYTGNASIHDKDIEKVTITGNTDINNAKIGYLHVTGNTTMHHLIGLIKGTIIGQTTIYNSSVTDINITGNLNTFNSEFNMIDIVGSVMISNCIIDTLIITIGTRTRSSLIGTAVTHSFVSSSFSCNVASRTNIIIENSSIRKIKVIRSQHTNQTPEVSVQGTSSIETIKFINSNGIVKKDPTATINKIKHGQLG